MDGEKVASLATMSGIGSATLVGASVTTIGIYLAIGALAGCAGWAAYKVGRSACESFSAQKAENKSTIVVDEVA